MVRRLAILGCAAAAAMLAAASAAGAPPVRFHVYAQTGLRLTDVVWTGTRLLYVENTTNAIYAAGDPPKPFASMPRQVEETRCVVSPAAHGFAGGDLYCHAPEGQIYRIGPDGAVTLFATLPTAARSDGALAFDTVGRFGFALLAATGRSGAPKPAGGTLFAIDSSGGVRRVGSYAGPGGADELVVAPRGFGALRGDALLAVDAGKTGALVALGPDGRTQTSVHLSDGPNPIAVVGAGLPSGTGGPPPGLYVTDTSSKDVYLASDRQLARFAGAVIVGSELRARFWVVRARGSALRVTPLATTLRGGTYNLEAAAYVSR